MSDLDFLVLLIRRVWRYERVNRRRTDNTMAKGKSTDNTMAKGKGTKEQTTIYKTYT